MSKLSFVLCSCVGLVACSNKPDDASTPTPARAREHVEPAAPAKPSTPWTVDAAAIQAKLQGAWAVTDQGYAGSSEAWEVSGDQVKIWDAKAKAETVYKMSIDAPCQLTLEHKSDHGEDFTISHFVFEGDTLHMGLGDAGIKAEDKIVACSNGVFVVTGTTCQVYNQFNSSGWQSGPATCTLTGDKLSVREGASTYDESLMLHGNVLASDQLWANKPTKVASYDEAKTRATANAK